MTERHRLSSLLGEFVVIVVGVFVALAAQSWYEGWTESHELDDYLDRLVVDLEADSASFQLVLDVLDRKDANLDRVARVSLGVEAADSTFFESLRTTQFMGFSMPGLQRATFDDMVATGNLRLIRNPSLRAKIVGYYRRSNDQLERIEPRRTDYPGATYRLDPTRWNTSEFEGAYPRLVKQALDSVRTPGFMNLVTAERSLSTFERQVVEDLQGAVQDLLPSVRRARESV